MADYKELLRRAVEALPENNGAARRAVYEKARAALVGQLRAINPPLAARDITAHRLQLEDCIRQVEQEASEAVIAGLGSSKEEAPPPPPVYFEPPAKKAPASVARPVAKPVAGAAKEPPRPLPPGGSIEEIIAAANAEQPEPAPVEAKRTVVRPEGKPMGKPVPKLVPNARPQPQIAAPVRAAAPHQVFEVPEEEDEELPAPPTPHTRSSGKSGRPLPSIVARAEAAKSRTGSAAFGAPIGGAIRGPELTPRRELAAPAARHEPAARGGHAAIARQVAEPVALFEAPPIAAAMSAVREVEVEPQQALDPQVSIDRAIATLDREARGDLDDEPEINGTLHELPDLEDDEAEPQHKNGFNGMLRAEAPAVPLGGRKNGKPVKPSAFAKNARQGGSRREAEHAFPRARDEGERRGLGAVTIFLIVFVVLLLGAGGAGYWAWREGFINLDQMFGRAAPVEQQAAVTPAAPAATDTPATGPGNTDTPAEAEKPAAELAQDDRLASDAPAVPQTQALPLAAQPAPEERLGATAPAANSAEAAVAAIDPTNTVGGQSLLLEASDNGKTGAVPFSGSIEWSKGTDEMGLPTLIGKASIPARNLSVDLLIRKNSDTSLPASHLMEVNFKVNDSFIGGSIAGLPGVLLKNEELVQGTPLVGASARVVGNSFLFALSASPEDITANSNLLTSRKYMDLALIYATGKRAIITLEKDPSAVALFNEVVGAWGQSKAASAQ
jgi:hypothetical protein